MRYTYEFKKKAVELYRQGKWIDAPNDIINLKNFHDMIVRWHHLEESNTSDCLKHYGTNKKWSPEEKYELVARVIAGDTITSVAYTVGINSGLLAQWIRKYKIWGYNGLVGRRKGRKPKESAMKKMNINNPRKLNESEYEELIRLRAEITYIKAENEAIKKEIALREEREAALLKAKKQQSSKNSKKKGYLLKHLLKAMNMTRSTYYFEINKTDPVAIRNEELLLVIKKIFVENKGRYGVRRVYMELKNRGYNVNHKRVQRLMHDAGLFGKRPKEKYHSYKGEVGKVADNVINRNFSTTLPLQKWTTDVSQFNFSWGKCYLSPILDMNTNEIISYDLALSPNLEQIKRMLDKAFDKYSSVNGLILHSDQGWQYQHAYYRNRLKEHGIIQSMSRKGNCYDNCIMETFFGRIKTELYYGFEKDYTSFEEFAIAIDEYIDYYNSKRIQAKTKWMPPVKYREASMMSA